MFDAFSEIVSSRILKAWQDAAIAADQSGNLAGLDMWRELNPGGDHAVAFSGTVTISQSLRTRETGQAAIAESASAMFLLLIAIFGGNFLETWVRYAALALGCVSTVSGIWMWVRYFSGEHVQSWDQNGWLNSQELTILRGYVGTKILFTKIDALADYGDTIVLTDKEGSTYHLSRSHVSSDRDWEQIRELCRKGVPRPEGRAHTVAVQG